MLDRMDYLNHMMDEMDKQTARKIQQQKDYEDFVKRMRPKAKVNKLDWGIPSVKR